MSKTLALFDFDGTITTKDTLLEFIKFVKGDLSFYLGFLLLSPFLVAMKLKLIPNWKAKERVLTYFFKGIPEEELNHYGREFCSSELPALIRPGALLSLKEHIKNGSNVVVISASAENWIKPWADNLQVTLVATKLKTENKIITGQIEGKNCYGIEKVTSLKNCLDITAFDKIYAYGDSRGDREMLDIATHPNYKLFK